MKTVELLVLFPDHIGCHLTLLHAAHTTAKLQKGRQNREGNSQSAGYLNKNFGQQL